MVVITTIDKYFFKAAGENIGRNLRNTNQRASQCSFHMHDNVNIHKKHVSLLVFC